MIEEIDETLPDIGERFLPWSKKGVISYEHIHRYAFASLFTRGKKVLDLASGEGYGSHMLSLVAKSVTGIEIDEQAVEHAKRKYASEKLSFLAASIEKVPIEGERIYDVIVCFEAIEHVAEHNKVMSEVKRLLKEDGLFIISTPDKQKHSGAGLVNPFHIKELYFEEFVTLLNGHFKKVNIWGQKAFPSSYIWNIYDLDNKPVNLFNLKRNKNIHLVDSRQRSPMFFIAMASDVPIEYQFESILIDLDCILFNELNELNELNTKKDAYISYFLNSRSWRITAPLRWLHAKVINLIKKIFFLSLIFPTAVFVLMFWVILLLVMITPLRKEKY